MSHPLWILLALVVMGLLAPWKQLSPLKRRLFGPIIWLWNKMSQATRILLSLIAGLLAGTAAARFLPDHALDVARITDLIGHAWMHGLQMVIVPLIVGLLVTGVGATAAAARAGRITAIAIGSFVVILWVNTIMSAFVMPLLLRLWPLSDSLAQSLRQSMIGAKPVGTPPSLLDFFDTVVPSNVVSAAASDAYLPLTIFALALAFAITRLEPSQRKLLTDVIKAFTDAMIVIIGWVLKLAPIGVFALAYGVGAKTGLAAIGALLHYIIIVSSVGFIVLLSAYPVAIIYGRVSPLRFAREVAPAQAMALSTQSSLATLPAMLAASEKLGASPATAGIVLPIAVAIFRATSPAMNLAVALYVAHLLGVPIGPGALFFGVVTAAITTMGSISLPGTISYIASVAPVAAAMHVPLEPLGLLIAVETIPDLFRTIGNVTMDVAVTLGVARRSGGTVDSSEEVRPVLLD